MSLGLSAGGAALVAAGIGAAGAAYSAKTTADAAGKAAAGAQFAPYNVYGPSGSAEIGVDPSGKRVVNQTLNSQESDLRSQLLTQAGRNLFGFNLNNSIGGQAATAGYQINPLFEALQGQQYQSAPAAYGYGNIFGQVGAQQGLVGQRGFNAAFSAPNQLGLTSQAQNLGSQFLDPNGAQSFNALAAQRLSALRGLAQPQEEQMVNAKFNDLFSRGQLGTTGGAQALGQLSLAQQQADQARITQAQDFAQQQSNMNNQLGLGLFSQAFGGYGQNQQYNLGLGQLGANAYQQQSGNYANALQAFQTGDTTQYSQGQQRLANAQAMFGFGNQLTQQQLDQALQQIGGAQTFDSALLNQAQLGASVGAQQAYAGANAGALAMKGATNPFGAALQGLGTAGFNYFSNQNRPGNFGATYDNVNRQLDNAMASNPGIF